MRINELIVENQNLDEISLAGIGKGIAKGVGATAKGIGSIAGGAVGAWDAAKQGYQAGKANVSGRPAPQGSAPQQAPAAQPAASSQAPTQQATGAAQPATTTPTQQQKPATTAAQPAADDPALASLSDDELKADLAKKSPDALARAAKRDLGPRLNAMVQAELQKRQSQPAATAGQQAQPAAGAAPAAAKGAPAMKAPPVVQGGLDGIKKAYSNLDPAERDQLKKDLDVIDDQDRLASGTNESLEDIIKLARR